MLGERVFSGVLLMLHQDEAIVRVLLLSQQFTTLVGLRIFRKRVGGDCADEDLMGRTMLEKDELALLAWTTVEIDHLHLMSLLFSFPRLHLLASQCILPSLLDFIMMLFEFD